MRFTAASLGIVEVRTGAMYYFLASDGYFNLVFISSVGALYQRAISRKSLSREILNPLRQYKFNCKQITPRKRRDKKPRFRSRKCFLKYLKIPYGIISKFKEKRCFGSFIF